MVKLYTYRIYPTEGQQKTLIRYYGCVRYVYNKALQNRLIQPGKRYKDMTVDIQKMRVEKKWLEDCPAQCLQVVIGQLCNDHSKFQQGCSYPVFMKKDRQQSITFPQGVRIKFREAILKVPKLGIIKCIYDRRFTGKIKTVTLYKTVTGKYYIKVLVDNQKKELEKLPVTEGTSIGISAGINTWYGLSNGTRISKPARIQKAERNIRVQQKALLRKQRYSHRRDKQVQVLLLAIERLKNMKRDYLQKVSTKIIMEYDTIVMENTPDELKALLQYKCQWYRKNLVEIGKCQPCPDICSVCGTINHSDGISWVCTVCENVHNRNRNNAENIKRIGLRNQPSVVNG